MSAKTRIVVLHMKEIVYTAIFVILSLVLILLLFFMFRADKKKAESASKYIPGIYTSTLSLNNTVLEVEVIVDHNHINSIRFTNLDESVTTVFPLVQPELENIADQIYKNQTLDDIALSSENPYTSRVIFDSISQTVEKSLRDK